MPRRRALLFILYPFASGAYSYTLLFFVVRFSYNLASNWLAEFAFIPAAALAFFMFRSRLRSLRRVILQFWQEKFGSGSHWRPVHFVVAVLLAALLFLPIWRDREDAFFVIEPTHSRVIHASVPGRVNAVLVKQGEQVRAGQPLLRMNSYMADSMRAFAVAQTGTARFQTVNAELHGQSTAPASPKKTLLPAPLNLPVKPNPRWTLRPRRRDRPYQSLCW